MLTKLHRYSKFFLNYLRNAGVKSIFVLPRNIAFILINGGIPALKKKITDKINLQLPIPLILPGPQANPTSPIDNFTNARDIYSKFCESIVHNFLSTEGALTFPKNNNPDVTIIMVLYNRVELTFSCLSSLLANRDVSFEVIIVDNASTDATNKLLKKIHGVRIINNKENTGFILACNQAVGEAKCDYLLFINNDTWVMPGAIKSVLDAIKSSEDIGVVGAKLVHFDGNLQAAGDIVWKDGSAESYGRGDDPMAPEYMFQRDVDYCCGAFMLTKRKDFLELGGFSLDFLPFYYEDVDYCFRLKSNGKRSIYDPNAIIYHYENASSKNIEYACECAEKNRNIFCEKHQEKLRTHFEKDSSNILFGRTTGKTNKRILFIEEKLPLTALNQKSEQILKILKDFLSSKYLITIFPLSQDNVSWNSIYQHIPQTIEIMNGYGHEKLFEFLTGRKNYYQAIIVNKHHYEMYLKPLIDYDQKLFSGIKIFYEPGDISNIENLDPQLSDLISEN